MVKRIVVGAHYGLRDWLVQRISAAVMALYAVLFVLVLAAARPTDYVAWKDLFRGQAVKLATFLFFIGLFVHAWVGMRDILMDYAKPLSLRLALQVVVAVLLLAWTGWAIQILWSV
ncbi:MAG TPA: succinate dehydrogenase, hydrophobic membrane anchor protein [Burkholderiales bacterium]|nr:succinate dehydrogenase, hydrophobic membrane anchor protein [Burkholderiales bacterium]